MQQTLAKHAGYSMYFPSVTQIADLWLSAEHRCYNDALYNNFCYDFKFITVINDTWAVTKESLKNPGLNKSRTHDLCDTGAVSSPLGTGHFVSSQWTRGG